MSTTTAVLALTKNADGDNARTALSTDQPANMDILDALFHTTTGHNHNGTGTNGTKIAPTELTMDQLTADTAILTLRSTGDVAHGCTDAVTTATFGRLIKAVAANGGLLVDGYSDGASQGIQIQGTMVTADATRSTAGVGAIVVDGNLVSGTAQASLGADRNIMAVRDSGTTRFILDTDGDSHQDVGTAWTNFHNHDDIGLITALAANVSRLDDPIRESFGSFLLDRRIELERLRLVTFNENGHHFVNMSRLTMLLVGAIQQIGERMAQRERQLGERLALIETRLAALPDTR